MNCLATALIFTILSQGSPVTEDDLTTLPLDALIAKLPEVGHEVMTADGERTLHPASAEFARRLQAGRSLTPEQWRRALIETGALRVRQRWAVDEPIVVSARTPKWLEIDTLLILDPPAQLGLRRARVGSFHMGLCGNAWTWNARDLVEQELGLLPPGRHDLLVRLELWRRNEDGCPWFGLHLWFEEYLNRQPGSERGVPSLPEGTDPRMPDVLSRGELVLPIEVLPTTDAVLPPVASPRLDVAVRKSVSLSVDSGGRGGFLHVEPVEELGATAISLDIQVFHHDTIREEGRLAVREKDEVGWLWVSGTKYLRLHSLTDEILRSPVLRSEWRLTLRGTDDDVLSDWDAERRWAGVLKLSVDELLETAASADAR